MLTNKSTIVQHQPLTQQMVAFGLLLWLLLVLGIVLGPQGNLLPSPLNTAHVRATLMMLVAGPLLPVFCSPGAVTVALVVNGPAAVGRTTIGSVLLPPAAMLAMVQVTVVLPLAVQPAANMDQVTCLGTSGSYRARCPV
jgi:hypothetical protein